MCVCVCVEVGRLHMPVYVIPLSHNHECFTIGFAYSPFHCKSSLACNEPWSHIQGAFFSHFGILSIEVNGD